MVIYATEYEKQLIVRALRDYVRQCSNGAQAQAIALAAAVERAYRGKQSICTPLRCRTTPSCEKR